MKLLRGSRVTFLDRGRDLMKKSTNSKNERQYCVLEGFGHAGGSARTLSDALFAHLDAILGYVEPEISSSRPLFLFSLSPTVSLQSL